MAADVPTIGSRILVGRGTRQTEVLLLGELEADLDRLGDDLLARPALLVVPSQSLRLHLLTVLAARRPAIAGLWCRTLYGLAAELTRQAGMRLPGRLDPLMLIARRLARDEPSLRSSFEHLVDGYRSGAASVSDLMDAAFDAAHAGGLDDALVAEGPAAAGGQALERARAVVRVAARSAEALEELSLLRRPTVLLRAAELVRGGAPTGFAPAAVHVYGFADATGVATDLIEALLERHPTTLYLDQPEDPAEPDGGPAGPLFGRRFRERVQDRVPGGESGGTAETDPPRAALEAFRALGAGAEAREVARRLRRMLDAGERPERLGIVARRLEPYLSSLRVQLRRYGVPFSGLGARGPATSAGRVAAAVLALLLEGRRAPIERWLDARQRPLARTPSFDLRLALHSLGAARLEELAALPLDKLIRGKTVPLPVRLGFDQAAQPAADDTGEEEPPDRRVRLRRRSVKAAAVREAARLADDLCRRFDRWPAEASLSRHLELLRELLEQALEWRPDHPLTVEIERLLEEATRGLEEMRLEREELLLVLREVLGELGRERLGGEGAGIQILDATEARGRTFDHLFLIGLNGGLFPRTVREDPLLSDPLRRVLARSGTSVLPDLPLKREGSDEERHLFAQLLSSAPRVTLSWQQVDDDNGARTVSPLVERLRWSGSSQLDTEPPLVRPAYAPHRAEPAEETTAVPRPLLETAVEAALGGARAALEPILALGFEELTSPRETAAARLRILDELDPPARSPALGPYLGIVGPPLTDDDPRRDDALYITTLERMCGCPWQTLLTRVLRLEPLPDPLDTLPRISPLLVGNVVHRVAEVIVKRQLGDSDDGRMPPPGRLALPIAWPEKDELERILLAAAEGALAESGVALPGFARVVALAVGPYLEELRRLDWADGGRVQALGSEVHNRIDLAEGPPPRRLAFRIDRIDGPNDRPLHTDYKTGRGSITGAEDEKKQRRAMLAEVRAGLRLQVPAYALAGGGRGRYLFVNPEFKDARQISVDGDDSEIAEAFERAVDAALAAWRQGAFPPRLVAANRDIEPKRCNWCEVAHACLRGDSGARGRLRDWGAGEAEGTAARVEEAALAIWRLPLPEGKR